MNGATREEVIHDLQISDKTLARTLKKLKDEGTIQREEKISILKKPN
jgi:DNA-binding HxlR family transcriptional regulator